jgi:hypothetical protein
MAACSARKPPNAAAPPSVCRTCFWDYQPKALRRELVSFYRAQRFQDPLLEAERRMLLAVVTDDAKAICRARRDFEATDDPARALFVAETLAFTAASCGADGPSAFRLAAARARLATDPFKAGVYTEVADGSFAPQLGETTIERSLDVPYGASSYVLGSSRIVVQPGERVGAQVDRTVRDWLSSQLAWDRSLRPLPKDSLLTWHEGALLRDLLDATDAKVLPLGGALAVKRNGRWLAASGDGVFRYEVLDDKIQYPTTLIAGDLALIVDTHGISALVAPASREGVSLVVGCGDTAAKMKAAFDLAKSDVDVWFPCDRFAGDVVGYVGSGVLIGSAPVRREGDHAVIGDRPISFAIDETIVVEDFEGTGALRYYDAAARYFRALAAAVPIRVDYVPVDGAGQSGRVVDRARSIHASAIGVRVETPEDAAPVRAWLAAAPSHRAVLFHTAPYPAGIALFDEFPRQTTFGDARPVFR